MAPTDNSTRSSVKTSGGFMAEKRRGMESMKYTKGQNRETKIFLRENKDFFFL